MIKRNYVNLIEAMDRLKYGGKLSFAEIKEVKARLKNPSGNDDIHYLVQVLSLAARPTSENISLVEQYLNLKQDPYFIEGAIIALCQNWNRHLTYSNFLIYITDPKIFDNFYEAGTAAYDILARNINKPNYLFILELLFKRWQEAIHFNNPKLHSMFYLKGLNKVIETAIIGEEAQSPFYSFVGRTMKPEWEEVLETIIQDRNNHNQKHKKKFDLFNRVFARA